MSQYRQLDGAANNNATTASKTWPLTTQSGSCLLALVAVAGGTDVNIHMPAGWVLVNAEVSRLTSVDIAVYIQENAAAQSGSVTATFVLSSDDTTPSARYAQIHLGEWPGMVLSGVIDKQDSGNASSQIAAVAGTPTTSSAGEVAIAFAAAANAPAASDLGANTTGYDEPAASHYTSSTSGVDRISSAVWEKNLPTAATFDFSVPISGGISRAWCVKQVTLTKASGAPPITGRDDGKIHISVHLQEFGAIPDPASAAALGVVEMMSGHVGMPGEGDQYNGFADDLVATAVAAGTTCEPMPYLKGVHYQIPSGLTFPESWYAHSGTPATSGNRVHPGGFAGVFIMQPDSTVAWTDSGGVIGTAGAVYHGWVEYQTQLVKHSVQVFNDHYAATDPCTGAWLDSCGTFSLHGQVRPGTSTVYTSAQWLAVLNAYLAQVKAANPTITIIGNGVDSNGALVTDAGLDGTMSENWLRTATAGALPVAGAANAAWVTDMQNVMDGQVGGTKKTQVYMKLWQASLTASQEESWRRYAAASYLLAQQGSLFISVSSGTAVNPWQENYGPAWAVALGAPRDTATAVTWTNLTTATPAGYKLAGDGTGTSGLTGATGFVYRRRYAKGWAMRNTAQNPIVITLDRSDYLELAGTAAPVTYTVPAKSGVILTTVGSVITAPVNTVAPGAPTGTQAVGSTLTSTTGTWTGSPTFSYQWQRDVAGNGVFTTITGATSTTYGLQPADSGNKVRSVVTGTNAGGFASANSTATGLIGAGVAVPGNTAVPVVTPHTAASGTTLSTTNGTWTNTPTSFTYIWQTVDPITLAGTNIGGATAATFDLTDAQTGLLVRSKVTAVNAAGSAFANSDPTDVIAPRPPATPTNTVLPAAPTGTTTVGSVLTALVGTWTGSPTFTYQWQRVTTTTDDIPGATGAAYTLVAEDTDAFIQVEVTGTNGSGQGDTATSAQTAVITNPTVVVPVVGPVINPAPEYRYLLCARDGTPLGAPLQAVTARTITYQLLAPTIAALTVPQSEPALAQLVEGYTRLKVYREDDLVFHGRVWDVQDTLQGDAGERCTLTAYDPLYTFGQTPRFGIVTAPDARVDGTSGNAFAPMFAIVQTLIESFSGFADDETAAATHYGEMMLGAQNGTPPRVQWNMKASDLLYDWVRANLIDIDNGIEWVCRPVEGTIGRYDVSNLFGPGSDWQYVEQIAALDLYYPTSGAARTFTFGYGTGPANLATVTQDSPGTSIHNSISEAGSGDGVHPNAAQAHDQTSIQTLGVLFASDSSSDTGDNALLQQRAKQQLQTSPLRALTLEPIPGSVRLYDDCMVGDLVNVAINAGRVQRYGQQRVFGATLTLSDTDGTEALTSLVVGDPPTTQKTKIPRTPADMHPDQIATLQQQTRRLQQNNASAANYTDDTGDTGTRTRIGLQDDGTWGLRVWDANGTLIFDQTRP